MPHATDITSLDALALSAAVKARQLSCVEVMDAFLDRIELLNPRVNAIVSLQPRDLLRRQAQRADAQLARGEPCGPLHGLPAAIKDLEPTDGIRTTLGSPLLRDFVPRTDSIVAERIKRAGAILIGKTNVPEFGLGSHTFNPVFGTTFNAYDQSRTAGGSSGGAAVALALRMLPVADGSDHAGSLRNPAAFNNVFGFRTSFGRVPADWREVFMPSLSVHGPLARNLPDLALLLSIIAGYDERVPLSNRQDPARFREPLKRELKGTRLAWLGDFGGYLPFEAGVLDVCRRALRSFEELGCVVEEARPDYSIDRVWQNWLKLRSWQVGAFLREAYADPARRALIKPEARWEIERGFEVTAYDIADASVVRTMWYQAVRAMFENYDFLILPSAQVFPFDASLRWPSEINGTAMDTYHRWMEVSIPITMAGCPALNVPAGFDARGLPMGIQIAGPNHAEMACMQLAYAYDEATHWVTSRPPRLAAG
ncbi:MAG: amidase [Deltaproteobacteria bacterium]|nr:amidase [Deltaproteobacteria bacterium]